MHTATCLEFKDGGADEKDVLGVLSYVGERSRTFTQRVEENMKALNRQDPKSFQLVYWAIAYEDEREFPNLN